MYNNSGIESQGPDLANKQESELLKYRHIIQL